MVNFEVAKSFERELLQLSALSTAEGKFISLELGEGLEHDHNGKDQMVAEARLDWSIGKV